MRLAVTDRVGHTITVLTGSRLAVAGIVLGGIAVMTATIAVAAPGTPLWPALLLLSIGLLALADSESPLGLVLLLGFGAWWLLAVPGSWSAALLALPAAAAVLAVHLALAHEAAGPGGVPTPHTQLGSLVSGAAAVLGVTALTAGLVALAEGRWATPAIVVGAAAALLALVPWLAFADLTIERADDD